MRMQKGLMVVLVGVVTTLVCALRRSGAVELESCSALLDRHRSAIVIVEARFDGGNRNAGMGVFVSAAGELLIPMHVVRDRQGQKFRSLVVRLDPDASDQQRALLGLAANGPAVDLGDRAALAREKPEWDLALVQITRANGASGDFAHVEALDPSAASRQTTAACVIVRGPDERLVPYTNNARASCGNVPSSEANNAASACGGQRCGDPIDLVVTSRSNGRAARAMCISPYVSPGGSVFAPRFPVFDFGWPSDAPKSTGWSGAPAFERGEGSLYGVINLARFGGTARGVMSHVNVIQALRDLEPANPAPSRPWINSEIVKEISDEYTPIASRSADLTRRCGPLRNFSDIADKLRTLSSYLAHDDSALEHPAAFPQPATIETTEGNLLASANEIQANATNCDARDLRGLAKVYRQTLELRRTLGAIRTIWSATRNALIYPDIDPRSPGTSAGDRISDTAYCESPQGRPARMRWLLTLGVYINPIEQILACELSARLPPARRPEVNAWREVAATDPCEVFCVLQGNGLTPSSSRVAALPSPCDSAQPRACASCLPQARCDAWTAITEGFAGTTWLNFAFRPDLQSQLWGRAIDRGFLDPVAALAVATGIDRGILDQRAAMLPTPAAEIMNRMCSELSTLPTGDPSVDRLRRQYAAVASNLRQIPAPILAASGASTGSLASLLRAFADPRVVVPAFVERGWYEGTMEDFYPPLEQNMDRASSELKTLTDDVESAIVAHIQATSAPTPSGAGPSSAGLPCLPPAPPPDASTGDAPTASVPSTDAPSFDGS